MRKLSFFCFPLLLTVLTQSTIHGMEGLPDTENPTSASLSLACLPSELIVFEIFQFLLGEELGRIQRVCRSWKQSIDEELFNGTSELRHVLVFFPNNQTSGQNFLYHPHKLLSFLKFALPRIKPPFRFCPTMPATVFMPSPIPALKKACHITCDTEKNVLIVNLSHKLRYFLPHACELSDKHLFRSIPKQLSTDDKALVERLVATRIDLFNLQKKARNTLLHSDITITYEKIYEKINEILQALSHDDLERYLQLKDLQRDEQGYTSVPRNTLIPTGTAAREPISRNFEQVYQVYSGGFTITIVLIPNKQQ